MLECMLIRHCLTCLLIFASASLFAEGDGQRYDHNLPIAIQQEHEFLVLEVSPPSDDATDEEKDTYWEQVREQYEAAKAKGVTIVNKTKETSGEYYDKTKHAAGDAYRKAKDATADAYESARDTTAGWYEGARDWTQEDIKKAGSWRYRIVVIDKNDIMRDPGKVENMLNELGAERFECYWVEPLDDSHARIAFFFKKSGFSYLKSLPSKELWRFIPMGGGEEDSENGSN